MSAKPRRRSWLPLIGLALFTLITFFLAFTLRWGLTEWGLLSMDEIVIQLNMSIGGTAPEIMRSFYFQCVLPAVALTIIAMVLCWLPFQRKVRRRLRWGLFTLCIATLAASVAIAWHHFNAGAFFSSEYSELIDASVVTPDSVRLTFPEKKRNLVYIFLESVETTFADCESGGAFADNYMPELTELAQTYEDFSGDSPALNGAIPMTGSTWTIGAMVTHTSGLPMKLHTSDMYSQGLFFPNMRNLGDILHEQGYNQLLMIGSDGNFGGRASLFTQHGDFKVEDYFYAREQGWIPPDYRVFWGYEDMYLFRFAREELLRLAQSE